MRLLTFCILILGGHAVASDAGLSTRPFARPSRPFDEETDYSRTYDAAWSRYEEAVTEAHRGIAGAIAEQYQRAMQSGLLELTEYWKQKEDRLAATGRIEWLSKPSVQLNWKPKFKRGFPHEFTASFKCASDIVKEAEKRLEEDYSGLVKECTKADLLQLARRLKDDHKRLNHNSFAQGIDRIFWHAPRTEHLAKGLAELPDGSLLATQVSRDDDTKSVSAMRSVDGGATWQRIGEIARAGDADADLGDSFLLVVPGDGGGPHVYCSYRHNLVRGENEKEPSFSIRVAISRDGGLTWDPPSTVAESHGQFHGLWSSSLFCTADQQIQCYYDDEHTPAERGFRHHQWIMMKTRDPITGTWRDPVEVSRTSNVGDLARDGMATVSKLSDKHLVCIFESVSMNRKRSDNRFPSTIRMVESFDGGRTWNWTEGRQVVYEPAGVHMAISPCGINLTDDVLLCMFATDEDRPIAGQPGSHVHLFAMDIKYTLYHAKEKRWSMPSVAHADKHRDFMPVVLRRKHGPGRGTVLLHFTDFSVSPEQCISMRGDIIGKVPADAAAEK